MHTAKRLLKPSRTATRILPRRSRFLRGTTWLEQLFHPRSRPLSHCRRGCCPRGAAGDEMGQQNPAPFHPSASGFHRPLEPRTITSIPVLSVTMVTTISPFG
ncbi:hypothetical protein OG21DRAFT_307839 [Imleria badia]|nr:hypothetical protein OG21DRAFT_307839 [Imleria badia]